MTVFLFDLKNERIFSIIKQGEGTSVRNQLIKSMSYGESVDMMYIDAADVISKRRIQVLSVGEGTFQAYCHLRRAKRTFKIDNVLALVPVIQRERMVI